MRRLTASGTPPALTRIRRGPLAAPANCPGCRQDFRPGPAGTRISRQPASRPGLRRRSRATGPFQICLMLPGADRLLVLRRAERLLPATCQRRHRPASHPASSAADSAFHAATRGGELGADIGVAALIAGWPVARPVIADQPRPGPPDTCCGFPVGIFESGRSAPDMPEPSRLRICAGERTSRHSGGVEPVSGVEPLTCRLQDGCSAC